jgi:hypothetical protein
LGSMNVLTAPAPTVSVRGATASSIEYEIVAFVDDLSKKTETRNALFELSHRHLFAAGVRLRSLNVPQTPERSASREENLLHQVDIFSTLDDAELKELASAISRHEFQPGETVYSSEIARTEERHSLHVVALGVAALFLNDDGPGIEVRRLSPGDAIGHSGILTGISTNVTLRAVTAVTIYRLSKESLTSVLKERPQVALQMCRILAQYETLEASLRSVPLVHVQSEGHIFDWLHDGIKRFHDLVFRES